MSTWIRHHFKGRYVWYRCDNCTTCQDQLDAETTYAPTDCTRHELHPDVKVCYGCDHLPCRCDEIDHKRKYPWEN